MTDKQKNKNLKERLIKSLIFLGRSKKLLVENEIAFKVKGFNKCIFKFPYNKNAAQLLRPGDGETTANN